MRRYNPQPINTADVEIPKDLMILTEQLAENTHDVWALARMNEGWTYGPERDDVKKTHPCLIPYNELPDSEKEYDRNTALETIKLILKMGYVIRYEEI